MAGTSEYPKLHLSPGMRRKESMTGRKDCQEGTSRKVQYVAKWWSHFVKSQVQEKGCGIIDPNSCILNHKHALIKSPSPSQEQTINPQ